MTTVLYMVMRIADLRRTLWNGGMYEAAKMILSGALIRLYVIS